MATEFGTKRRYDFGGEILEAIGGGQLVPSKRQKNEIVEVLNQQQQSLVSVVSYHVSHLSLFGFFVFAFTLIGHLFLFSNCKM